MNSKLNCGRIREYIPSADRAANANSEGSFVEIPVIKWACPSAKVAR